MRLSVRFMFYCDGRAEGFCIMQTLFDFTEDSHESKVILWCGLLGGCLMFQFAVCPLVEPSYCSLVSS